MTDEELKRRAERNSERADAPDEVRKTAELVHRVVVLEQVYEHLNARVERLESAAKT